MASNVQPARGMRDFLPADKERRETVLAAIRDAFASYGYRQIETPVVEDLARLTSGQGGDNEKLIFRILRRGLDPDEAVTPASAADLGLRYDLTVPLARFYATHRAELPAVFRSIQIAPVWRAERPQRGRYRQFTQCDIDVLGEPSALAEVELLTAGLDALRRIGVTGLAVRLNDRRILVGMLAACGVPADAHGRVLITVDKLDKIGVGGVADELRAAAGAGGGVEHLVALLADLAGSAAGPAGAGGGPPGATDGPAADAEAFAATLGLLPDAVAGPAGELAAIRDAVVAVTPDARLVADPTLVRGMGYYTGTIFELAHPGFDGSVGGGGRYDGMIGRFSGTDVAACGLSIGFERVVGLADPARLGPAPRRVALVYDAAVGPAALVGWQQRLIADGASVRLVPRARNTGRLLDGLAAEGFEAYAALDADAGPADTAPSLELRPLAPAGGR